MLNSVHARVPSKFITCLVCDWVITIKLKTQKVLPYNKKMKIISF